MIYFIKYIIVLLFIFSDILTLKFDENNVPLLRTGIAWPSDKNIKYQNPPGNSLKEGMLDNWTYNLKIIIM